MNPLRAIIWYVERSRAKDTYAGERQFSSADPPPLQKPTLAQRSAAQADIRRDDTPFGRTWDLFGDDGYTIQAPAVAAAHKPSHTGPLPETWIGQPNGGVAGTHDRQFRYDIIVDRYTDPGTGRIENPNPPPGYRS